MNWLTAQAERPCAEPEKHVRSQESAQRFHTRIICFVFAYTDHLLGEKRKSFHAVVSCLSHKSPGYETRKYQKEAVLQAGLQAQGLIHSRT